MSRPASLATGGYFPLPVEVVPLVARLLKPVATGYGWAFADLCMGMGDAICGILRALFPDDKIRSPQIKLYGVEMEHSRYLAARRLRHNFASGMCFIAHGDSFRLSTDAPPPERRRGHYDPVYAGASAILLNPPYDNGVMEVKFLAHSLPFFGQDGVLVYVIPVTALALSAPLLAQHFTNVQVYRFPAPHYAAFKQVVVVGTRCGGRLGPDTKVEARLRSLCAHPDRIPELTKGTGPVVDVPSYSLAGFPEWKVLPTNTRALLAKIRPWHMTTKAGATRPIPGIMPEDPSEDLMAKRFPIASLPRPAYVSAALAADIYSGKLIHPHDPASTLPPILVKGVFDKANVEVDERVNKEGQVTGKVTIEQPRLAVTVLDLRARTYHTLANSVEVTGATTLGAMTMGDLLEHYGQGLLDAMFEACPILHDSRNPAHEIPLPAVARPLYKAQAHAVMTCVKLLGGPGLSITERRGQSGFLYGQVGVGKTGCALTVMRAIGSRRPVLMCPPNILQSWRDQIAAVTPEARVRMLDSLDAVDAAARAVKVDGEEVGIISREGAKLGHAWQGIGSAAVVPLTAWGEGTETGTAWLNEPFRAVMSLRLVLTKVGTAMPVAQEDPADPEVPAAKRGKAELFLAVETSDDGITWRYLGRFPAGNKVGEVTETFRGCGRWLRAGWTATGEVTFALEPTHPLRAPTCPTCGAVVALSPDDLARKRARCTAKVRRPRLFQPTEDTPLRACPAGRMAEELAHALLPVAPSDGRVTQHLHGRHARRVIEHLATLDHQKLEALRARGKTNVEIGLYAVDMARERWAPRRSCLSARPFFVPLFQRRAEMEALPYSRDAYEIRLAFERALFEFLAAVNDPAWAAEAIVACYATTKGLARDHGITMRELCRKLLLLLPAGGQAQRAAEYRCCAMELEADEGSYRGSWDGFRRTVRSILDGRLSQDGALTWEKGAVFLNGKPMGDVEHAVGALEHTTMVALWDEGEECGERLYQAVPIPRRYPVAKYITKRYRKVFDFFILDESHQYASPTSAQSFAARRMIWTGMPCLLLTGTSMGGYAEQLFTMQWAIDREFRAEFDLDEVRRFVEIYGFLKRVEEDRDRQTKAVVTYGSMSDRVDRSSKVIGSAPGVLPHFLLRFMLRKACILHRSDFDFELPGVREIPVPVKADEEHQKRYVTLREALKKQIKADKRDPEKRGKLMGQLTRLPAYLDMATADCGNAPDGGFEMSYPPPLAEKVKRVRGTPKPPVPRGKRVCHVEPFPKSTLLAKERAMIAAARAELAEGRPVAVFAWNAPVLARLHRVLSQELGEPVAFLQANKVDAEDRQAWIDREVIGKGIRVIVVNAICVGIGLNNLVYFPTAFWFENPLCDAVVRRQADGRFDRLGKTLETRIYVFYYEDTLQEQLFRLWTHKIGVSLATDGLDASGALAAAGVGEQDVSSGLAIANVIYLMINGEYQSPKAGKAAVALGAVFG